MKSLVIFSGGQDSTTCLGYALKKYDEVYAVNFNYGQNHAIEVQQARAITQKLGVKLIPVDISFFADLTMSALVSGQDVNKQHPDFKELPASFVPNRNALFLVLSHTLAQKLGIQHIVAGMCQTDFSGYPDCREQFINAMKIALELSSKYIEIETPLMFKTKAQTFQMAEDYEILDEVIFLSHTCYEGDRNTLHEWGYGCGECPACKIRAKGWEEYKLTKYDNNKESQD